MNETEMEVSARLTLHAFLLEQILANQAMQAANPKESWERFSAQIMDAIKFRTTARNNDESLNEVHRRLILQAEQLMERVAERIAQGYK